MPGEQEDKAMTRDTTVTVLTSAGSTELLDPTKPLNIKVDADHPVNLASRTAVILGDTYGSTVITGSNLSTKDVAKIAVHRGQKTFLNAAYTGYAQDNAGKMVGTVVSVVGTTALRLDGHFPVEVNSGIAKFTSGFAVGAGQLFGAYNTSEDLRAALFMDENAPFLKRLQSSRSPDIQFDFLVAKTFATDTGNRILACGIGDAMLAVYDPDNGTVSTLISVKKDKTPYVGSQNPTQTDTDFCDNDIPDGAILLPMTEALYAFLPQSEIVVSSESTVFETRITLDGAIVAEILAPLGKQATPERCARTLTEFATQAADEIRQAVLLNPKVTQLTSTGGIPASAQLDELAHGIALSFDNKNESKMLKFPLAQREALIRRVIVNSTVGGDFAIAAVRVPFRALELKAQGENQLTEEKARLAAQSTEVIGRLNRANTMWVISAIFSVLIFPLPLLWFANQHYKKVKAERDLLEAESRNFYRGVPSDENQSQFLFDQLGQRGKNALLSSPPEPKVLPPEQYLELPHEEDLQEEDEDGMLYKNESDGLTHIQSTSTDVAKTITATATDLVLDELVVEVTAFAGNQTQEEVDRTQRTKLLNEWQRNVVAEVTEVTGNSEAFFELLRSARGFPNPFSASMPAQESSSVSAVNAYADESESAAISQDELAAISQDELNEAEMAITAFAVIGIEDQFLTHDSQGDDQDAAFAQQAITPSSVDDQFGDFQVATTPTTKPNSAQDTTVAAGELEEDDANLVLDTMYACAVLSDISANKSNQTNPDSGLCLEGSSIAAAIQQQQPSL